MEGRFNVTRVDGDPDAKNGGFKSTCEDIINRKKSLAQLTREALPRLDNYRISKRGLKRPSLGELHGEIKEMVSKFYTTLQ